MKFIVSALAIIGAISIVLSLVFVLQLLIKGSSNGLLSTQIINSVSSSTIGNNPFIKTTTRSNSTGTKPNGFIGPSASDTPHAIGPTTPPPNY